MATQAVRRRRILCFSKLIDAPRPATAASFESPNTIARRAAPGSPALSGLGSGRASIYALVEAGDSKAIDVYLSEQDAQRALEDSLRDEPQWRGRLEVKEVELDHEHSSLN
jgi:hypothetical protein